jgi:hypothetical protein
MTAVVAETAADWRRRLDAVRPVLNTPADPVVRETLPDTLRHRFRELTLRTRSLHRSPHWQQGAFQTLMPRLRGALSLSQLLADEFQRADPTLPTLLAELLTANELELRELESQLRLCGLLGDLAEELHPLIEPVVYTEGSPLQPWWRLADDIQRRVQAATASLALVPADPLLCVQSLAEAGWERGAWLAQSLLTARTIAGLTPTLQDYDREVLSLLIIASLLQDIATWHEVREQHVSRSRGLRMYLPQARGGRIRANPHHPAAGAAMLDGLSGGSAALCRLVGEHHERLDGTGAPRHLMGLQLSAASRWLQLIVRWTELLLDPLTGELAAEESSPLAESAGVRIWREVRRGAFDRAMANAMLDGLQAGLTSRVEQRFHELQLRSVDARHSIPAPSAWSAEIATGVDTMRADAAVPPPGLQPPMFVRRQRDGQRRSVSYGALSNGPQELESPPDS